MRSGKWAAPRPLTSTVWVEPLPSVTFGRVRAHVGKGKVVGFMDEFRGPGDVVERMTVAHSYAWFQLWDHGKFPYSFIVFSFLHLFIVYQLIVAVFIVYRVP